MRIIGFNGPPRSGKDTLARVIRQQGDTAQRIETGYSPPWGAPSHIYPEALIMPCRHAAFAFLGKAYDVNEYEHIKDQPQSAFNGETLRRFMIRLSEEHLKPSYGRGFYGRALTSKYEGSVRRYCDDELMLVTDIGFQEEVDILSDFVDESNFMLVQVARQGCDWSNDSRGWTSHPNRIGIPNNGTVEEAVMQIYAYGMHLGWEF